MRRSEREARIADVCRLRAQIRSAREPRSKRLAGVRWLSAALAFLRDVDGGGATATGLADDAAAALVPVTHATELADGSAARRAMPALQRAFAAFGRAVRVEASCAALSADLVQALDAGDHAMAAEVLAAIADVIGPQARTRLPAPREMRAASRDDMDTCATASAQAEPQQASDLPTTTARPETRLALT